MVSAEPTLSVESGSPDFTIAFATMAESAPLPMAWARGADHLIGDLNAEFCRLLGKPKLEFLNRPFAEVMEANEDWMTVLDRVYRTGEPEVISAETRGHTARLFRSATVWRVGAEGAPMGVIIQLAATVPSQAELVAMNEALLLGSVRQHEFTEAAEKERAGAESASQAKDHFLAVLSHELRTPLTPVLLALTLLTRRKDLPPDVVNFLRAIERNVKLEGQLIDEILDYTSIGRGKVEFVREPVDIREVLRHAAEVTGPDFARKHQHLNLELESDEPMLLGDGRRLRQVFWNLLRNASKFSPEHGAINISLHTTPTSAAAPGCMAVKVSDSGIGFAPEVSEQIFDAFTQANRTVTREFGGLGLGLAIAKVIVGVHNGVIRAYSPGPGQGSTFTVEFPLHEV